MLQSLKFFNIRQGNLQSDLIYYSLSFFFKPRLSGTLRSHIPPCQRIFNILQKVSFLLKVAFSALFIVRHLTSAIIHSCFSCQLAKVMNSLFPRFKIQSRIGNLHKLLTSFTTFTFHTICD